MPKTTCVGALMPNSLRVSYGAHDGTFTGCCPLSTIIVGCVIVSIIVFGGGNISIAISIRVISVKGSRDAIKVGVCSGLFIVCRVIDLTLANIAGRANRTAASLAQTESTSIMALSHD
jgi:hypothetical protein